MGETRLVSLIKRADLLLVPEEMAVPRGVARYLVRPTGMVSCDIAYPTIR
jgi:hypothetical protein